MTATSKQAHPVHVHTFPMQNTSWIGPPAPTQQQDFCEQTPIDEARDFVTLLQLL